MPDTADGAEGTEASDEEFADASPGLAGLERTMHSVAVFSECSYEFVEAIMLHVRKILLHAGKVLVSEDTDAPKSMYAVLWGTLDVYRMGQKIGSLSNGQVLGEGLLVGIFDRWTTTVVARNSCMVCEVPQTALSEALLDHPEESEYFKSLADYFGLRAEEWAQHGSSEMRLALRRPASLRQVSEDFLAALEAGLVSHLYFAGDVIHTEGQEDPPLAFLFDGDVSVEAAGRAVRREEVPSMEMRFLMEGETTTGRGSTAITDSETLPGSPTAKSRRSSASGRRLSQARRPSVDTGEFNSSLMAVSNRARAEAMMAEATAGGPEPGFTAQSLPEAAVFGEEAFLGLIPGASVTVRVCKMSEVRLLYRSVFDQTLERFPADREWLQRFQLDAKQAFPFHDFRDHPICQHVDLSNEFFDFLSRHVEQRMFFPGDHILPDNLNQFVPSSILSPTLNISCAAVNVGHVRLQTLHDQPLLPFGHLSSGDILGPGSILPGSWFWSGAEVQALQLCCLTVLHRGIIARALEEYPREREKVVPLLVLEHQQQSNPRSTVTQVKSYRQERVAKILRERSIFSNTSQEFLAEILNFGTVRVFMPGDRIIQQGAEGNSMFILSVGMAEVVKESLEEYAGILLRNLHFIGGLTYGSVFGELVMLGVQSKRTASIIASSTCCTWEVENQKILSILNRHPVERTNFLKLVEEHLDKLAAPRVIYHKLFADFSQQFRTLIGVNCERKLFFPQEVIVKEGGTGNRMYIMNLGSATVKVSKQCVMQIRGGSHFGFNMLCSDKERYTMSITTDTMCQVLVVTRSSYQHALSKYPEMREVAKQLEARERARERKQFAQFTKLVQRRRGLRYLVEALRDGVLSDARTAMNDNHKTTLLSVIRGWRHEVAKSAEIRREDEQLRMFNDAQINKWLQKRKEQLANVRTERELTRDMINSLASRGPVQRQKRKPQEAPTIASGAADWSAKEEKIRDWTPYMTPAPVWRRSAYPAKQRLAQIGVSIFKNSVPMKPVEEATPTLPEVTRRSAN